MAGVLAQAVADLRQVPAAPIEIKIDGTAYQLTPRICGDARAEAGQRLDPDTGARLPHNTARRVFINAVVRRLARQGARDFGGRRIRPSGDAEDLRAELAAAPAILSVLDVLWPEFTPQQLLTQLYQAPAGLTSPTANAPPSPATRQARGHPPTCPCSTNWPSSSDPSPPPR